jgi:PAS domain S-box-containing protein
MLDTDQAMRDVNAGLLAAIVSYSQDAIVSKTLDGIVTSWNPAAELMFGYTAKEIVGRSILMIIPPELYPQEDYVLSKIRRGERIEHFETIRQTKDGRRLSISLTVSPIRDRRGVIVGASKIARDITGKKQSEREREWLLAQERAARQELAEALRARDEFIAVAAHEFRNPLNVFHLTMQLLHRLSADPARACQIHTLLAKCDLQLASLTTLVDRLLDVSRVRAGKLDLYREHFDLSTLVRDVVAKFNAQSGNSIALAIEREITITGDRMRLEQAVSNLVSNAIKYGEGHAVEVEVEVRGDERKVAISVRDQGIGISGEDLERIFNRFERVTNRSWNQGLGLGLWITKQIIEAHGGAIRVASALGKGSVFTLELPWQVEASAT